MFLSSGQQRVTFSLSAFSLPLDPSYSARLQLQCPLSSRPNLSAPSSRLSFCASFLYPYPLQNPLQISGRSHFFTLSRFSLFLSPWTDPSLSMCASLYVPGFDNPLEPLSPIKSRLECSLPVSEGFAEGWGCLCGWYVSHL